MKVVGFAGKIISSVGKFFFQISEPLGSAGEMFRAYFSVFGLVQFVNVITSWINDFPSRTTHWQKTAFKVISTVSGVFRLMGFLQMIKAVDFDRMFGSIGNVPVFGVILNSLNIVSLGFHLWSCGTRLRHTISKVKFVEQQLIKAQTENKAIQSNPATKNDHVRISSLQGRISQLQKVLQAETSQKTKAWLALINVIARVALMILAFIGLITGIAALSMWGIPMGLIGLALAGFGFATFIYDQVHQSIS